MLFWMLTIEYVPPGDHDLSYAFAQADSPKAAIDVFIKNWAEVSKEYDIDEIDLLEPNIFKWHKFQDANIWSYYSPDEFDFRLVLIDILT